MWYGRTYWVRPFILPFRRVGYLSATHVVYSTQARHDSAAQLFGLVATDGTCEYFYVNTLYLVFSSLSTPHSPLSIYKRAFACLYKFLGQNAYKIRKR